MQKSIYHLLGQLLVFELCFLNSYALAGNVTPVDLRCDYNTNPLGIDSTNPRLFWKLASRDLGACQTAYRVLVATSEKLLVENKGDLWDSGKVKSDQATFLPYAGKSLVSRQNCYWKVRVWDQQNQSSHWSTNAMWKMGLLSESDWHGGWISSDLKLYEYQKKLRALPDFGMEPEKQVWTLSKDIRLMTQAVTNAPAVWMRKEFDVPGPIRRATVSVSGLGLFELYVNGRRIGDHQLDPAFTDYEKRVFYLTHDITTALQRRRNAIGVLLGNGWFNLVIPHALRFYAADYIAPPQMRLDLEVELTDGSRMFIGSDKTWRFTTDGPIRFNSILSGETYDGGMEMPGWAAPGFNDAGWRAANDASGPEGRLVSQRLRPVRKVQEIRAKSVSREGEAWRFDLGEETVGWPRLRVSGKVGQKITIQLPGSGSHTLGRYQTSEYIFGNVSPAVFETRFCYAGYRYVDVSGLDYEPSAEDCIGQVVCTDLEPVGSFSCSDARLNQLQQILLRTVRNYVVHIPNDPTREKAGWTQDVESGFFETVYNFDSVLMYRKWQRDCLDIIHADGYMPPVAPGRFDGPTINGPWWGGCVVYAPWWLYEFYGDRDILAESYPAMKAQFAYLSGIATNSIVSWGLGDWMEVGSVRPRRTPVPLTSTCAYYWFACILSKTAVLLGKPDEARRFTAAAEEIRAAYNREFYHPDTGDYASGSQTCQLVSLVFGLVPDAQRHTVIRRLVERVVKDDKHLTTGFVGTPLLLQGLTDLGFPRLAWDIATQTNYPSFIDAVLNPGNTVLKEDWSGGLVQMPSLQGPVGTWFYHSLAGIRQDPTGPGFKRFLIKPETANDLTWVKAHLETLHGRIVSEWRRENGQFNLSIAIPVNTSATVFMPADRLSEISENGKPASHSAGLKLLRMEGDCAVFAAEPGHYQLTSKPVLKKD